MEFAVLRKNVKERGNRVGSETRNKCVRGKKEGIHVPSAEPSVRKAGDVKGKTGTDDQTRRLQHLRHT